MCTKAGQLRDTFIYSMHFASALAWSLLDPATNVTLARKVNFERKCLSFGHKRLSGGVARRWPASSRYLKQDTFTAELYGGQDRS